MGLSRHTGTSSINLNQIKMSFFRVLLAILFPPLAVIGKGCGSFLIVLLLTFCGWVPGVIAALVILNNPN
ncbi:YqaE/Pmp3 family membrane protein [Zobellia roscoffensis]